MDYIVFKKAKLSDCENLAKIKHKAWEETYRGIYDDQKIDNFDYPKHIDSFEKSVLSEEQNLYCIVVNNNLAGYFCFGKPKMDFLHFDICINSLYILSQYKQKGIGTKAFNYIKSYCIKNNFKTFCNGCNFHNIPAQKFYEKMGGQIFLKKINNLNKGDDQIYYKYLI